MSEPRLQCAYMLQKILEQKVFFAEAKARVQSNELPFVNMLMLTVLRHYGCLRKILYERFLHKKIPAKKRIVEYLLICATAELLYLNTPVHAVINYAVENVKKCGDKFMGNMANAVLRRVAEQRDELRKEAEELSPIPDNFLPLLAGYEAEQIAQIAKIISTEPPLDITVKNQPAKWAEKLAAELLPNGSLRLYSNPKVTDMYGYNDGQWWVQDAAAALPVQVMGDLEGRKVIDLCAAPGGKTAQLAAKGAQVTAIDISDERLQVLQRNMRRLGFENVETIAVDAADYMQNTQRQYDAVLLDAPCSASGTLRRHPEVLHIKNSADVEKQVAIQKKLLHLAARIVKPNGILLYCVCSIAKAEGEEQIAAFISEHKEFKIMPISNAEIAPFGKFADNFILPNGTIRTLPYYEMQKKGIDSFFICKMQRII